MNNSTNPIKALVQRFVSLEPALRMSVTKKLLELYGSDMTGGVAKTSPDVGSPLVKKSFLEQFWEEVEKAHNDRPGAINPFTQEGRRAQGSPGVEAVPENGLPDGYLHWRMGARDLFALL